LYVSFFEPDESLLGENTMGACLSSTPPPQFHDMLEQITLQMASNRDLQMALAAIQQGFVDELDGAFARIWFLAGCGETLRARRNFIGLHV
jgi:hypothetical protein